MSPGFSFESPSPEETQRIGRVIGQHARSGDVFLLTGPLGAGKTCLTQGIAQGLGVEGNVRSPTFVIMMCHEGRLTLHHVDLYRLGDAAEAWDLGLEEQLFGGGVCVIEWAERAAEVLPPECLWLKLDHGGEDERRTISISPGPERYDDLVRELLQASPGAQTTS